MRVVTDTNELARTCSTLAKSDFVAIDTEFMRESTFWPDLCLIQMAAGEEEVIVDTISEGLDLSPFFDLMTDEKVTKVFHAARQDIEIVHHLAQVIPAPVFDTQIAAMVCGFGESVSYGMLVKKMLNREIDKSSRFTDWSRRPLTPKQLTYAIGDVTNLRDLFPMLKKQLEQNGRARWLDEEMAVLTNPATYESHPEDAWKRLKMRGRSQKALGVMMALAEWREREAQAQNVPRRRVMKDDAIYDIVAQAPTTESELANLRSVHKGFSRSAKGRGVIEAVKAGLNRDPRTLPPIKKNDPLGADALALLDLLRVLLKAAAGRHGVAPKLIATAAELEDIARDEETDLPSLKGWRRDLFGADAIALRHGRLGLTVENGRVVTFERGKVSRDGDERTANTGELQDTLARKASDT
ncbi:MAG TPA: ribonuclease D [Rhizobiales bacterium]|nr:ribonuclease D [bacterium BMS3Bbin10]HDO53046.1 ribonuclease D [Hyphomicrobiales bacterium]